MTRFARAKGSKSSNERREEEATPWHVMRQQLAEQLSNDGSQNKTNTLYNLKEILRNKDNSKVEEVWSDFGEKKTKPTKKLKNQKGRNNHVNSHVNNHIKQQDLKTEDNCTIVNQNSGTVISIDSKKKRNVKEIISVAGDSEFLNKGNLANKNVKNRPEQRNSNQLNDDLRENKCVESVRSPVNKFMERNDRDIEYNIKSNNKKRKVEDASSNSGVSKKKKNNSTKNKNVFIETPIEQKTGSFKMSISTEDEISETSEKLSSLFKSPSGKKNYPENIKTCNMTSSKQKSGMNNYTNLCNDDFHESYYRNNNYSKYPYQNKFQTIIANGREIHIVQYQGFYVKKDDADELKKLRKKLQAQNIPKEKLETIMKLERRKAEKALAREKKKVCFHCRQFGHNFSDCPDIKESDMVKTGVCFKCGSLEHSHFECKVYQNQEFRHAVCFVCKEQGHIARQCPLNSQGLYPKGGSCHLCGDITHLRKDCPQAVEEKTTKSLTVDILKDGLVEDISSKRLKQTRTETKKKKVIKFN